MADNQLQVTLEQREWDRLQKLSERNGESMEVLVAKMVARELARTFNKPPDEPLSEEVKRLSGLFSKGFNYSPVEEKYLKNANKNIDL